MTFIPNNSKEAKVGDKIQLTKDVKTMSGTFTKGHVLACISIGERGHDFEDINGNKLLETGLESNFYTVIEKAKN
jgi:hypothetical protein